MHGTWFLCSGHISVNISFRKKRYPKHICCTRQGVEQSCQLALHLISTSCSSPTMLCCIECFKITLIPLEYATGYLPNCKFVIARTHSTLFGSSLAAITFCFASACLYVNINNLCLHFRLFNGHNLTTFLERHCIIPEY